MLDAFRAPKAPAFLLHAPNLVNSAELRIYAKRAQPPIRGGVRS